MTFVDIMLYIVTDQCAKCSISAVLYVIGNNEKMDWCYSDI